MLVFFFYTYLPTFLLVLKEEEEEEEDVEEVKLYDFDWTVPPETITQTCVHWWSNYCNWFLLKNKWNDAHLLSVFCM